MSEETKEVATPPTPNNTEVEQLKESVKKLEAKNYELIGKLQNQKKEKEVPEDYESLLAFKQKHEREQLESEGKYTEATQALEQQYRDKSAEDKKRIEELSARNRELELIAPAMQALSEITHDPELVLNNLVPKDQMQIKEGIEHARNILIKSIRGTSREVKNNDDLLKVATISAGNDTEVGLLIASAIDKVGRDV